MPFVLRLPAAILAIATLASLSPTAAAENDSIHVALDEIRVYSADDYSQAVTACDRLAGHPSDPNSVTDGVSQAGMDKPAAIDACRKAVAADPDNPRLNYQLARAYGYSGMHEEAGPYREVALRAGYPQSLFVMGYILVTGWSGTDADPCYGGELIRRSAEAGRYAGLVGFPYYAVKGTFTACEGLEVAAAQLEAMLDEATERGPDYYQGLLIDLLRDRIKTQFR
ncbi:tetratricopeptide repeat protein [Lentisalinibacter salinarum]|uniref:tetratricopeptide repeat protein n=1 Tax=Lentisalinibacter salinarum TaxID=2992239 RepID=UPI00386A27BE